MGISTSVGVISYANQSPVGTVTTYSGLSYTYTNGIAFDGTDMWVPNYRTSPSTLGAVSKISPTGTVTNYTTGVLAAQAGAIAFDNTDMWFTYYNSANVGKITSAGTVTNYGITAAGASIAFDGTDMWVTRNSGSSVYRINSSGTVINTYTVAGLCSYVRGIAFDGTNMWVLSYDSGTFYSYISKITPGGTVTDNYFSGKYFNSIIFDGTNLKCAGTVAPSTSISLFEIDLSATVLNTYTVADTAGAGAIVYDGYNTWIGNNINKLRRVTPAGTFSSPFTATNTDMAFSGTYIWGTAGSGQVNKISV